MEVAMFKYETIQELVDAAQTSGKKISDIFIEDQAKAMEISPEEIIARMDEAFQVMIDCTVRGADKDLRSHSGLTGGEGYRMLSYAADAPEGGWMGSYMTRAVGRALSASVSNAAMGKIVAAPTAGSCGILPGCLVSAYEYRGMDREACVRALFTAGAFGLVVASVASIAGAEGGCQAECGSASGMAAAALVELLTVLDLFCGGDYLAVVADDFIRQRHGERIGAHRQDCHNGKAQEHHKCNGLYPAFTGVGTDRVRAAGDLGDLLARYGFLSHIVCLQCAYIFVIRVGSFGEARQASTTSPPVFILALQILI